MEKDSGKIIKIAVDGPSGAGKSTVAKIVASEMGIEYIDTGAMYRAIALKLLSSGIDALSEPEALDELLENTDILFENGRILLDGEDVSGLIRTAEVTAEASRSSAVPSVREKLVSLQRAIGEHTSVIMDGRDIGTNVFKDADYKFYIEASPELRAKRRFRDMTAAGMDTDYEKVLADIRRRDYDDSHRALNPLAKADDAILIVSDGHTVREDVDEILSYIDEIYKH